ncbi:MAG: hypothetical protein ACLUEU_01310 [Oscillospiraceae bacterium]
MATDHAVRFSVPVCATGKVCVILTPQNRPELSAGSGCIGCVVRGIDAVHQLTSALQSQSRAFAQ